MNILLPKLCRSRAVNARVDNKIPKLLPDSCETSPIVVFVFRKAANYHLPRHSVLPPKCVIHVCQPRALVMTGKIISRG
jgi:hypothetical protein